MHHLLPAVKISKAVSVNDLEMQEEERGGRTLRSQDFRHALLLREEGAHLKVLEETSLALPAHDRLDELFADDAVAEVAHLDHNDLASVSEPGSVLHLLAMI